MKSVSDRIIEFNKDRDPVFLKLKYKAMQESPFRFFRGTCHLFYEDFSKLKVLKDPTKVWICGDLHLENYGSYKAGNGQVYFDVVDFDEGILAPVTWEIIRTLTSIHLAVASLNLPKKVAESLASQYFDTFHKVILSGKPVAFERNTAPELMKRFIRSVEKRKFKTLFAERTVIKSGKISLKIINHKTVKIARKEKSELMEMLTFWLKKHENWKICDAVHRIAGTGSLGLDRYVLLMKDTELKKYFLLDMKQAAASCLARYIKIPQPEFESEARRVTTIQNLMQNVSPPILETLIYHEKSFIIKKLQPQSDMMRLELCKGDSQKLTEMIDSFAEMSASAQLRSTGRLGSGTADDLIEFFSKSENLKSSLLSYSKSYAEKVSTDFADFCTQIAGLL